MPKKACAPGLIVLLSVICLASIVSAQTSWWRTYGGTSIDEGYSVQQTMDGGYVLAGYTYSYGAGLSDVYLVKTNARGDTLWTRTYGGPYHDEGYSVRPTADGGYIIAGRAESFGAGRDDVYLIKTNALGDTLWTRTYGGPSYDVGNSVQQTTDGGYIIAGILDSNAWLIETDSLGDKRWSKTYANGGFSSVLQTAEGGYVAAGKANSSVYFVKTNAVGDTLWTRCYGGPNVDRGNSVQPTADGGYIIAGYTWSSGTGNNDVFLVRTNASGDTLWTRTYGGPDDDRGFSVQQASDGGYIITGYTESFGGGLEDVYIIKTDAQGDTLWTRTYGGPYADQAHSVQQTADGGYVIAGFTAGFETGEIEACLIKTDANGNVGIEEPLPRHPASPTRFLVQPSPFTSFARVPGHETELFTLSDVTGRQVAICKGDRVGEGLRPGVYFLSPVGWRAGNAATATVIKVAF